MRRAAELSFAPLIISLSLTLLTATGCNSSTSKMPTATKDKGAETVDGVTDHLADHLADHAADSPAADSPSVTADDVTLVDKAGFDQFLAEHKGQVVFVDYWATWCGTCKEQFPHTVELQRKFGDRGLIVVAASVDEPSEDSKQSVAEFLTAQGGDLKAFILKAAGDEDLFEAFGIEIAVPHYQLFDQDGQLVKKFVFGDPTVPSPKPEEIEAAVSELLAHQVASAD